MKEPPFSDIDALLQRLLDNQIEPEERQRLEKAMREDPLVREYYADSMLACAVLRRSSQATGELSEAGLIQALSRDRSQGRFRRMKRYFYPVAAILILGMVMLTALNLFRHRPKGPAMGVLAGTYEAKWRGTRARPGEPLYAGAYDLREGAAEMSLAQGTSLVLEAPCQIEITPGGDVTLKRGRLAAVVPSQAKGFRVRTTTALITDLGTEFGVIAHPDESTEAHVLKGRVRVALDPNKSGQSRGWDMDEGQAAIVDTTGRTIRHGLDARADLFLQQLPQSVRSVHASTRINLADIVGGGNGRGTGTLDRGINVGTGQAFRYPITDISQTRQTRFRSLLQFRGIDGVFVPNGSLGTVTISSTGLVFSECPKTTGSYYGGPANSAKFFDLLTQETYTARLNGVSFGTSGYPVLSLHANAGITFDLDEIRQDHPNVEIGRLTAMCGIHKDLPHRRFSPADVWILLDGVVDLHLRYSVGRHVVENVDVPISAQTRFLTLATTCSGRADFSWIILGDPFLGPVAAVRQEDSPGSVGD